MDNQPLHILAKMGVLKTFSISKKITEAEVENMMQLAKNKSKDQQEALEIVKAKIMKEIIEATKKGTLPGIILEKSSQHPIIPIKAIDTLNHLVVILTQKLKGKKYDKLSLCYFINYLVGALELKEEDFEDFHRRLREASEKDDSDDDS